MHGFSQHTTWGELAGREARDKSAGQQVGDDSARSMQGMSQQSNMQGMDQKAACKNESVGSMHGMSR
jgi:hypothetical protein